MLPLGNVGSRLAHGPSLHERAERLILTYQHPDAEDTAACCRRAPRVWHRRALAGGWPRPRPHSRSAPPPESFLRRDIAYWRATESPLPNSCVTEASEVVPVTRPVLALPLSPKTVEANCRRHFQERMFRQHEGWSRPRERNTLKMRRGIANYRTGKMGSPVERALKRTPTCGRVVLSGVNSGSYRIQRHSGTGRTRAPKAACASSSPMSEPAR